MCGVFGVAAATGATLCIDERTAARMRDRLAHRGPDGAGLWRHNNVILGHRRLAIIDVEHGHQPMSIGEPDSPNCFIITYNGELYNNAELRRELERLGCRFRTNCDTETVLHAYAQWGVKALRRLRGMFAFAIYHPHTATITLARDPLGIKPLYYATIETPSGCEFVFASEPLAILDHPYAPIQPDWVTLSAYLSTIRTTLGHRSMFAGVNVLQPGEWLRCSLHGDKPHVHYETYDEHLQQGATIDHYRAAVHEVRTAITASVQQHLVSDVPVCALLSGGLDSSIIALLASQQVTPLRTYCAGAAISRDSNSDLFHARHVADAIGSIHTDVPVSQHDFAELWPWMIGQLGVPLSTPNETAIYMTVCALSKHAKVALSGEGADELFAGYELPMRRAAQHVAHPFDEAGRAVSHAEHFLQMCSWIPHECKANVLTQPALEAAQGDLELLATVHEKFDQLGDDQPDLRTHLNVQRWFNLTGLLSRLDTAAMLASVEGRTPFADVHVASLAARLPMSFLFQLRDDDIDQHNNNSSSNNGGGTAVASCVAITKRVLRDAFGASLPVCVTARPKASFPLPIEHWIADHLAALDRPIVRDVFTPGAIEQVQRDPKHNLLAAWPMINIARWLDVFWGT